MIDPEYFSSNWIENLRKQYPRTDPLLMERTIYAFELLGQLVEIGKEFVFKGGTSILLLLDEPKRLSIDIDILGNFSLDELKVVCQNAPFESVEEQERLTVNIPKKHFRFFYNSQLDQKAHYVLLDVVDDTTPYPKLKSHPIESPFFNTENVIKVRVPTTEGLLGDKLTAFAPTTIGILYDTDKSQEIIKQLFDISLLFDNASVLNDVIKSYRNTFVQANRYRGNKYSMNETLEDTIRTGYLISQIDLRGSVEDNRTKELRLGLRQITNFLLNARFTLPEAREAGARAAFLAALTYTNYHAIQFEKLKYQPEYLEKVRDVTIEGEFQKLNRIKAASPAAFYYWWLTSRVRAGKEIEL